MKYTSLVLFIILLTGCSAIRMLNPDNLTLSNSSMNKVTAKWSKKGFHLSSFKPYTELCAAPNNFEGRVGLGFSADKGQLLESIDEAKALVLELYEDVLAEIDRPFRKRGDLNPSARVEVIIHFWSGWLADIPKDQTGVYLITIYDKTIYAYGLSKEHPNDDCLLKERLAE